jgi:transcriptional regulator NrdR family protein
MTMLDTLESGRRSVAAVPCLHCKHGYSRAVTGQSQDGVYRRRRVCEECKRGFITYEVAARGER